jgi:hypothetical protein
LARGPCTQPANGIDRATPKAILILEDVMPTLVGFSRFAALLEEQISEKIRRRILKGSLRAPSVLQCSKLLLWAPALLDHSRALLWRVG